MAVSYYLDHRLIFDPQRLTGLLVTTLHLSLFEKLTFYKTFLDESAIQFDYPKIETSTYWCLDQFVLLKHESQQHEDLFYYTNLSVEKKRELIVLIVLRLTWHNSQALYHKV